MGRPQAPLDGCGLLLVCGKLHPSQIGGSGSAKRVPKGPEMEAESIFAMLHVSGNFPPHTGMIESIES